MWQSLCTLRSAPGGTSPSSHPCAGAHCAGVARAAFREAGRCGTRTAGVVLKLCAVRVRPLWVSDCEVFCTSSSSRELPLAKQNPVAYRVSWQSGVGWRKPSVF